MIFDWLNYLFYPEYAAYQDLNEAIGFIRQGNYDEAIALLTHAIHLRPEDAYLYTNRGVARVYKAEYEKAIQDFSAALKQKPHDPAIIYLNRAGTYVRNGNHNAAINDYGEALQFGLDLDQAVAALAARGRSLVINDELERAEANYLAIFQLDSSKWDVGYFGLGSIKLKLKDYEDAIDNFTKALQVNPRHEYAFHNRAFAYIKQGDWEHALADIEQVIGQNPNSLHALNNRGVVRTHTDDLQGALTDFEKILEINSEFSYGYSGIGIVAFLQKEYDTALGNFKKAAELSPESEFTLAALAVTHHALLQFEHAMIIWQKLIEDNAKYWDADWVKQELK